MFWLLQRCWSTDYACMSAVLCIPTSSSTQLLSSNKLNHNHCYQQACISQPLPHFVHPRTLCPPCLLCTDTWPCVAMKKVQRWACARLCAWLSETAPLLRAIWNCPAAALGRQLICCCRARGVAQRPMPAGGGGYVEPTRTLRAPPEGVARHSTNIS
jgi:hypothetical protein